MANDEIVPRKITVWRIKPKNQNAKKMDLLELVHQETNSSDVYVSAVKLFISEKYLVTFVRQFHSYSLETSLPKSSEVIIEVRSTTDFSLIGTIVEPLLMISNAVTCFSFVDNFLAIQIRGLIDDKIQLSTFFPILYSLLTY